MSMADAIADYLTLIRNAARVKFRTVDIPESQLKLKITRVLLRERFIRKYIRIRDGKQGLIRILLRYTPDGRSVIDHIQRVSKPGRRIYYSCADIPRVMNGLGVMILTTPKGVVTNYEAHQLNVGGEPLCTIW